MNCQNGSQDSAQHRSAAVHSPGPRDEIRHRRSDPRQTQRERHSHAECQGGDEGDRDGDFQNVWQGDPAVEKWRQENHIRESNNYNSYDDEKDGYPFFLFVELLEALGPLGGIAAAQARKKQESAQHDSDRIEGVTEKKDEFLNKGDFDE